MVHAISLNKQVLEHIQKDYVKLILNPIQLKFIQIFSNRLCEFLDIPILAIRGIIWQTLREWQFRTDNVVSEMVNFSPRDRLLSAKEIFNIAKRRIKEILTDPNKQSEIDMLDIVFERAFRSYMNYLQTIKQ